MRALPLPTPRHDADAGAGTPGAFGSLPEWDLTDLYAAPDAPEVASDLDKLGKACAAFAAVYEGKLATLDADGMLACVRAYEEIDTIAGRLMSFAGLRYYQLTTDAERAQFLQNLQEQVTVDTNHLVFFTLEMNRLPDETLDALVAANADLARYKPIFERMRAMRPYQLSDELEKFLHDQSAVGAAAWNKLFDETMAGLLFTPEGEEEMPLEATLNLLTPDHPIGVPTHATNTTRERWGAVARTYVKALRDMAVRPRLQQTFIDAADAFTPDNPTHVVEMDSCHSPFHANPAGLARILAALS